MRFSYADIANLDKIYRLNLINSITGIKSANLIGTRSPEGRSNLAIFSSVIHLGSNPPLLGFILRPKTDTRRHTCDNIERTGVYTINHVPTHLIKQAHYTSAKFEPEVSEFEACQFDEEHHFDFRAPFVKQSPIKIALLHQQTIPIEANQTNLVIGRVEHLIVSKDCVSNEGYVDLERAGSAGISGLNSYYGLTKLADFPYARPNELPAFDSQ